MGDLQGFSNFDKTALPTPRCGDTQGLAGIRALLGKKCLVSRAISNRIFFSGRMAIIISISRPLATLTRRSRLGVCSPVFMRATSGLMGPPRHPGYRRNTVQPMAHRADDFPSRVKAEIAAAAGHRCSMPDCRAPTSGPSVSQASGEARAGIAAHIAAASPGGPRYDPTQSPQQRQSRDNAIWLCGYGREANRHRRGPLQPRAPMRLAENRRRSRSRRTRPPGCACRARAAPPRRPHSRD
jgi:hypothetical protein